MNALPCEMRDGYVGRWLDDSARMEFERHLASCPACREEIEEERRLDALLQRAAARLESPPAALREALAATIRIESRRRVLLLACAAAAATVLVAAGLRFGGAGPGGTTNSLHPSVAVAPPAARPPVRVDFAPESKVIGLLVETTSPDVSIVFMYPTLSGN